MPVKLFLEPGNPHDLSREELEALATGLRGEHEDFDVEVFTGDERGYGTTFGEVLRIYLELGEVAGATAAISAPFVFAVRWTRARWHKDMDEHPGQNPRPRYVSLLGPDGRELKTVRIDLPDGEPEDMEPDAQLLPSPSRREQ